MQTIEVAGRNCYKSEDKITLNSAEKFVKMLLKRGHEAMIEHAMASYRVICDRGVSHEIVRHRLFSYAQESTRYCNYKGGVTFIIPPWVKGDWSIGEFNIEWINRIGKCTNHTPMNYLAGEDVGSFRWFCNMAIAERNYCNLLKDGWTPQQARSVLPNSLKTEIVITGNLREWRHFFKLRCDKAAHPQMREVANMILADIQKRIPIIFDGIRTV